MAKRYLVFEDKVLVLRDSMLEDSNPSGILLTDEIKKPPCTGRIEAVGESVKNYVVGDRVVFSQYAGHFLETTTDLEETDLIVMREDELLCKEEEVEDTDASA